MLETGPSRPSASVDRAWVSLIARPLPSALLAGIAASVLFLITAWSPPGTRPLDLYVMLADAFLHGRADVPALSGAELAPIGAVWYVPFPPAPALIYLPLVALFGPTEGIGYVMPAVLGGAAVGVAHYLLRQLAVARSAAWWITAGFATTTLWWVATEGGTWHAAQVTGTLLALLALTLAVPGRFPLAAGLLLGLAAASRLPIGLALPLLIYLYRASPRALAFLLIGLAAIAVPVGMYNMARFLTPWDFGYALIPSYYHPEGTVLDESWFRDGILSVTYIPRSIGVMLFSGFTVVPDAPWLRPSVSGLSILLSAPIYLFALRAPWSRMVAVTWAAVILVMLPNWAHGSWGFWQLGYRFLLDASPFLIVLLGLACRARVSIPLRAAVVLGAAVTGYGLWAMQIANFVDRGLPFAP